MLSRSWNLLTCSAVHLSLSLTVIGVMLWTTASHRPFRRTHTVGRHLLEPQYFDCHSGDRAPLGRSIWWCRHSDEGR